MQRIMRPIAALFALALLAAACGDEENRPAMSGDMVETEEADESPTTSTTTVEASASFTAPESGATVARRFTVAMAADGIDIEPAGEVRDGAGHFHVIVDAGCVEPGEVIPGDAQHLHFGDGSMTGELDLPAGSHTLCLQLGDGVHTALDLTHVVTVVVA